MYGTRNELTARLAHMCPADEAIALFAWDTDCVRTQDEVMSDSEAVEVLALIGHMPADVWQEEGITFTTVQSLWPQEWASVLRASRHRRRLPAFWVWPRRYAH